MLSGLQKWQFILHIIAAATAEAAGLPMIICYGFRDTRNEAIMRTYLVGSETTKKNSAFSICDIDV